MREGHLEVPLGDLKWTYGGVSLTLWIGISGACRIILNKLRMGAFRLIEFLSPRMMVEVFEALFPSDMGLGSSPVRKMTLWRWPAKKS